MKHLKSAISFLLAALLLITAAPLQAIPALAGSGSAVSVEATDIAAGETLTAEVSENGLAFLRFVPETDGFYSFTSDADADTYGYLYDADLNEITHDDDSGGAGNQFLIKWYFRAGVVYYFGVRFYANGAGSIPVSLTPAVYEGDTWDSGEREYTVTPESTVTLYADAWSAHGDVSFQWRNSENEDIEGAVGRTLTVDHVTESKYYICILTFPPTEPYVEGEEEPYRETRELWVYVSVDNHIRAEAKDYVSDVYVAPGENALLQVEASCDVGSPVYQWYDADENPLEGETGDTLKLTNVRSPARYYCVVTDAYFTDEISVWFSVYVETGLTVYCVGEAYRNVHPGAQESLTVGVEINDGLEYHLQWFYNGDPLENETGLTCVAPAMTEPDAQVSCRVRDDYGNEASVCFYLNRDNEFTAQARDGRRQVRVFSWQPATLAVDASCYSGELSYAWAVYTDVYHEDGDYTSSEYVLIEDAADAEYVTPAITAEAKYRCTVSDPYASMDVEFTVLPVSVTPISLNEDTEVEITESGAYVYYSFTPEESGVYRFFSIGENDTRGYLFDADLNLLDENDDGDSGSNFKIEYELTAGETYYFAARFYGSDTGSFTVRLKMRDLNGFSAETVGDTVVTVKVGDTAVLRVAAVADKGDLHYSWADDNGEIETGVMENGEASLSVTPDKQYHGYTCRVWDDYDNEASFWFSVYADNEFRVAAKGDTEVYVPYNETTELAVEATALISEFTYAWYDNNGEEIAGENGPAFTTAPVTSYTEYTCEVTDSFGYQDNVRFEVYVENHFSVTADGNTDIAVRPGEDAVLRVLVTADHTEGMTVKWLDDNWDEIPGETGLTLTVSNVRTPSQYICEVRDAFGNATSVRFYVYVDTGLTASARNDVTEFTVMPGESVELAVEASAYEGVALTYTWYDDNWNEIENETGDTLTVMDVQRSTRYICEVSDAYGNSRDVYFYIYIDTGLTARARNDVTEFTVMPGESVELAVEASAYDGITLTYTWYDDDWNEIANETGDTFTVENVQRFTRYICEVSDGHGHSSNVFFHIYIDTGLTARARNGKTEFTVAPGESVELAVDASANEGVVLTYTWYDDNWNEIENETGDTFTVDNVPRSTRYICEVSDAYGNSRNVYFYIYIDTGLTVRARNNQTEFTVNPGESVELAVDASANEGVTFTYTWYDDNWDEIENETGDTFTVENVQRYARYICDVCDSYGNSREVSFYIRIDTGLTASARNNQTEFTVAPGGSAALAVDASANEGVAVTFTWYDNYGNVIETETPNELTVTGVNRYMSYTCRVRDDYGNVRDVFFHIYIDTGFTVRARNDQTEFTVNPGDSVELAVEASAYEGVTFTYTWYDGNWDEIENETGDTFTVYNVQRAARYICEVRDSYGNSREVEFYIRINTGLTVRARNNQTEFTVTPGDSVELAVEATADEGVSFIYTWYDDNGDEIENETDNTFTVNNVQSYARYICEVCDSYGNRSNVYFHIYIDTGLTARALNNKTEFSVAPGSDLTLTVVASANAGVTLTYEWHRNRMTHVDGSGSHWVEETVEGAAGPSLPITDVNGRTEYTCYVYDNYGGSRSVSFIVTVENGFYADAEKTDFLVQRGGSATLRVNAKCTEGALTYVWKSNGTVLEEDGAELTLTNVQESARYTCTVFDEWGNYTWIDFRVICAEAVPLVLHGENIAAIGNENDTVIFSFTPEEDGEYLIWTETDRDTYVTLYDADFNQLAKNDDGGDNNNFRLSYMLTAGKTYYYAVRYYDEGVGSFNVFFILRLPNGFSAYAKNDEYSVDVPYGETTALQVTAHADNGELYYKWTDNRNEILPSETDTLVTAPVTERAQYTCTVTDDYGNRESIMFTVNVDNRFTAHAVGDETEIYVMPGETAALAVEASAANGALSYQWFDYNQDLIENADTASYTFVPEENRVEVFCRVTDMYGNMQDVWFTVFLDNGFSVHAKDDVTDIYVPLGETALLETVVSYIEGDVTYQWYTFETREDDGGYTYNEQVPLAGCTSRAFRTPEVRDARRYMCRVMDEYGNMRSVYFNVCPEGGMRVEAENYAVVLVPYGETATLTAPAEADVPLTRQWTRYDYGENGGPTVLPETGASVETIPVTYRQDYSCEVSDVYGQRYYFYFTVLVDTGMGTYGFREVELYAAPGGSVTLDPGITPVNGAVLTYVWYNESEKLPFTGSAYTVENVTKSTYYYCGVTDEYGGWMDVSFRVTVPTEPTYRWNNDKTVTAAFCADGVDIITETVPVTERITPAACTVRGRIEYTAVFTNPAFEEQTITQTIPALGHLWSDWADAVAATCTAPGTQAKSCARCSAEKTRETEALGHVWSEPAYEWAADYSAVTATRVCMNDPSHAETETVSATAETSQSDCVSGGITTYTSAPFTNPAFEVQVITVELGDASHDWAEPTYEWAADHSAVTATRVCQRDASHVETETVPATYTETKAAACTEKGEGKYVSATFENPAFTAQTAVVELAALGHDFSAKTVDARYLKSEATCTEAAVYYKSCTRCGTASDTAVFVSGNPLGHDFSVEKAEARYLKSEATCTEPAVYYKSCSRCGAAGSATFVSGEALGHNFGDWALTTEPTCTAKGEETRACTRCDATETRDVEALGHNFGDWAVTTEPTCTAKGEETRACARCDAKETRDVEALGHNFGDWAVTTAPTCTAKGEETRTCARCDAKETRDVEALGHNFGEWAVTTAPTCTEKGLETRACSRCDVKEDRDVEALGHNFGDWAVTTAPTCTEKGVETRACARCDAKETRDVDALGHNFGAWTKYTADEHRRVCKNDATHTETAAHTWDNGKVTKPATVTQPGEKTYTCTVCGETKTEEIGKLPDSPVTVTDPASGVSVTYDSKAYSDKITVKVVAVATPENGMPAVYEKTYAVDISTFIGNKEVEPKAPVTVAIPVPAGFNAKTLALYHVKDDGSVEKVAFTVKDGKLSFTAFAFSVYVVADTSTEVKQPEFLRGDVDHDGEIKTGDARLALRKAIGLENYAPDSREFLAADVDNDGEVKTSDARYILRHAIGLSNPDIGW